MVEGIIAKSILCRTRLLHCYTRCGWISCGVGAASGMRRQHAGTNAPSGVKFALGMFLYCEAFAILAGILDMAKLIRTRGFIGEQQSSWRLF